MVGNVIVMAGVPSIMQAMLENVTPRLKTGVKLQSVSVDSGGLPEGIYASGLGAIQKITPMSSSDLIRILMVRLSAIRSCCEVAMLPRLKEPK